MPYIYMKNTYLLARMFLSIYAFTHLFHIYIGKQSAFAKWIVNASELFAFNRYRSHRLPGTPISAPRISAHSCTRANIKLPGLIYKLLSNKAHISGPIYNNRIIIPASDYPAQIPAGYLAEGPRP
jgi:hypothetical protein